MSQHAPTDSEAAASTTEAFAIFDDRVDIGVQTDDADGYDSQDCASLGNIDLIGEWQAIDDMLVPQMRRVAQSCHALLESHSATMEEPQELQVGEKIQVVEEVRSADEKLILCVGEVYEVLAFHDVFAQLEFMGDCRPDGTKIMTAVKHADLKCFAPWGPT